ncbi:DUF1566 domain-containing protein [Flavobacteriaceae bacterium]|nr:DUF1566 domain-containing protein [Flavobacteriaceae bacterium]
MKKLHPILAVILITATTFAQAPEKMSYQAVVRDSGDALVTNQAVGMQISILQGSASGTAVYEETQTPTTNTNGLVSLEIGSGTVVSGDFTTIDWSAGPYFIETAVDVTGGTSYAVMGTSQLMSVPYALHANTAENVTNDLVDDADADPANELQDISLTGSDLTLSSGSTIDLSVIDTDTDTQLDETAVDAFVSNNGYITSPDDADADPNNEIQTISRTGTTVTLSNGGGTFEDSVGVYTAGTGINITNNVISATEPTYTIGLWPELGGYVFWVSANGKHGLVAETQDQGIATWYEAQNLISNPSNHSVNGQKFRDWRLPTKYELNEMYLQQLAVGGFAVGIYWSSTELDNDGAWLQAFNVGNQFDYYKNDFNYVRSVRAF